MWFLARHVARSQDRRSGEAGGDAAGGGGWGVVERERERDGSCRAVASSACVRAGAQHQPPMPQQLPQQQLPGQLTAAGHCEKSGIRVYTGKGGVFVQEKGGRDSFSGAGVDCFSHAWGADILAVPPAVPPAPGAPLLLQEPASHMFLNTFSFSRALCISVVS
jgi:hypothetical protein